MQKKKKIWENPTSIPNFKKAFGKFREFSQSDAGHLWKIISWTSKSKTSALWNTVKTMKRQVTDGK